VRVHHDGGELVVTSGDEQVAVAVSAESGEPLAGARVTYTTGTERVVGTLGSDGLAVLQGLSGWPGELEITHAGYGAYTRPTW
jgi:hypothetical protein